MQATRICNRILEVVPRHEHAQALLGDLQVRGHEAHRLYAAIEQELDRLNLGDLTRLLNDAIRLYPDHSSGRVIQLRLLARAREYHALMRQGAEAFCERAWEEARVCFQNALRLDGNSDAARTASRLVDCVVRRMQELRRKLDEARHEGDHGQVQVFARELDEYDAPFVAGGMSRIGGTRR